jgi:acyl-CoA synthetase (AMP-forming)/AMP-acid ligase II
MSEAVAPAREVSSLVRVIQAQAAAQGDVVALVDDNRSLTYRELDERAGRVAALLRSLGVGPGGRVAVYAHNSCAIAELLLGCAKAGAVLVPVNWRLAASEVRMVLLDAEAQALFVGAEFLAVARELSEELPALATLVIGGVEHGYEAALDAHLPEDRPLPTGPGDVVAQLYTSGTTGVPKGVLISHRNFTGVARASETWRLDRTARSLVAAPLFHIGGLSWLFVGLLNGASNRIVAAVDPPALLDVIERERITHALLVPTVLQMLISVPGAAARRFESLELIAYGASPITTTVLRAAVATFRCGFAGLYGLTETCGAVTQLAPEDHDVDGPRQRLLQSAGRPFPWVDLRIADPATGAALAALERGEVWVRSVSCTQGYFDRQAETAALKGPDGWLRTGDGGFLDEEGYLFLADRIKDMIISGGENVYPVEVEEVLSRHPAVAEVAVFGIPDVRWGEAVAAAIVPRPGATIDHDELVAFARRDLAGYKLPRTITVLAQLPKTTTGKVLKQELRAQFA